MAESRRSQVDTQEKEAMLATGSGLASKARPAPAGARGDLLRVPYGRGYDKGRSYKKEDLIASSNEPLIVSFLPHTRVTLSDFDSQSFFNSQSFNSQNFSDD